MELPDTYYARASDGAYIAYQVVGDGPIDVVWQLDWPGGLDRELEDPQARLFFQEVARFARVIRHDRRGVGLSSRNVPPANLETRVSDTLAVLDAVGSSRPVLTAMNESGAPNALLAATNPELVHSMVWFDPIPRSAWSADYPWGRSPQELDRELDEMAGWGTLAYGHAFAAYETQLGNPWSDAEGVRFAVSSRNACTPDVARELNRIWYETDVRGVLPAIAVPTRIVTKAGAAHLERSRYVASLIHGAELISIPGELWADEDMYAAAEIVRSLAGAARPRDELDMVLRAALFTDIVGSTHRHASLGDHAWKALIERHHAIVREALERWRGLEHDTAGDGFYATFDGPARAIRCALEIAELVHDLGVEIRAGIHVGECEMIDGKPSGLTVTIGARIAALGGASTVLVSQTVKDLVAGSGFAFADMGEHDLKGVPGSWRLYRVIA